MSPTRPPWRERHPLAGSALANFVGAVLQLAAASWGCSRTSDVLAGAAGSSPDPREGRPEGTNGRAPDPSWPTVGPLAPPAPRRIGEREMAPGYAFSVTRLDVCEEESSPLPVARGRRRLGVQVSIENRSPEPLRVNPFYAELRDAEDHVYPFTLAGCEPVLSAGLVPPGATWPGWLSFDVRAGAGDLELRYAPPNSRGMPETQVRFSLGDAAHVSVE